MDPDADTIRATPFGACAPDAARALAARCLALVAAGLLDDAREAADNAMFLIDTIPHEEIAAPASLDIAEALVALGDWGGARARFEAALSVPPSVLGPHLVRRARDGLARLLPAPRAAGLRRAFDDA